jgi:hypothetical protein
VEEARARTASSGLSAVSFAVVRIQLRLPFPAPFAPRGPDPPPSLTLPHGALGARPARPIPGLFADTVLPRRARVLTILCVYVECVEGCCECAADIICACLPPFYGRCRSF